MERKKEDLYKAKSDRLEQENAALLEFIEGLCNEFMDIVKPGDKIKDNDPRVPYSRVLRVVETDFRYAYCLPAWNDFRAKKTTHRILLNRIHTDGKPRRTGFSLVEDNR